VLIVIIIEKEGRSSEYIPLATAEQFMYRDLLDVVPVERVMSRYPSLSVEGMIPQYCLPLWKGWFSVYSYCRLWEE